MVNKIIFIIGVLLGFLLTSCDKTYFEPNTPITQTDLSGTNWLVTPTSLIVSFDTVTIHFITSITYTIDTSSNLYHYNVYTSYTNEDLTFNDAPFLGSVHSSILPLGFKNLNTFYANLKDLYSEHSIELKFTKL